MKTSEQTNELSAAAAKANLEIKNAVKDAKNPHFKNDYASLASVLDAVREPLSKNGLSVIQATKIGEGGVFILETRLTHSSGQWIESETPLMLGKDDMQGLGSAITYARRYALAAMCGVSQADDDGEGAVNRPPAGEQQVAYPPSQAQAFASRTPAIAPKTVTRVGQRP